MDYAVTVRAGGLPPPHRPCAGRTRTRVGGRLGRRGPVGKDDPLLDDRLADPLRGRADPPAVIGHSLTVAPGWQGRAWRRTARVSGDLGDEAVAPQIDRLLDRPLGAILALPGPDPRVPVVR